MATDRERVKRGTLGDGFTTFAERPLARIPQRLDLVSSREVAKRLGINHQLAAQLIASEWVRQVVDEDRTWAFEQAGTLLMPSTGLDALADVAWADESMDYLNVRVGPATIDTHPERDRDFLGVGGWMDQQQIYAAVNRYWAVRDADEWVGKAFVASLSSYVVFCGRIKGFSTYPSGRSAFHVDYNDAEIKAAFAGRRIPVHQGTVVIKRRV